MERDFLGLNSKDSVGMAEEEMKDESKDQVFMRGSGIQWPFSNKVSALPQFMPFKTVQEERSKKIVFDPLASSGFMPISTADAFDTNHKTFTGVVQKNLALDKQGGTHYAMTAYPLQHGDTHSALRPHDIRTFPVSNHMISVAMGNPFFKTHTAAIGHNFATAPMKQQPLGGIPVMAHPHSFVPSGGSITVAADQRNISKSAGTPAQLTIFYGGSVSVYDDVSPEKAQAIMFLAGNGSSMNPSLNPRAQVAPPTPKTVGVDGVHGNQSHSTSPCSGLSSPMSVTSHAAAQSGCGSAGNDEVVATKIIGTLKAPNSQPEPPKSFSSLGSATATLMPAAVPQARKASLVRFLEKRKERVNSTMPYTPSKKSQDDSAHFGSNGVSFSGNTVAVSVSASKEQS